MSRHVSATRSTNRDLVMPWPWVILLTLRWRAHGDPYKLPLGSVCIRVLDNEVLVRYTAAWKAVQRHCGVQTRAGHVVAREVT